MLRVLAAAGVPLHQREVARRTGLALRTVELAVDDLLRTGIVERRAGGTEKVLQLRASHRLAPAILALLRASNDHWAALRTELRAIAGGRKDLALLGVSIVGRAARRLERLGDPVDLVVVTSTDQALIAWMDAYQQASAGLAGRHGAELRVIGYTLEGVRQMWALRTLSAEALVRDAELVVGESLAALVADHPAAGTAS